MATAKVGRNDPCPCGSGKKYKQCCGRKSTTKILTQEQLDELSRSLTEKLVHYATRSRFMEDFERAWLLHFGGDYEPSDPGGEPSPEQISFLDYLVHLYRLQSTGKTIVGQFLDENRSNLTPDERALLEDKLNSRYRIFEIQDVRKEEGLTVKDLFDDSVIEVKEKLGTRTLVKWDVVAGNILKVGECYEFSGHIDFVPRRIAKRLQAMLLDEYRQYQDEGGTLEFRLFLKDRAYLVHHFVRDYASRPPTVVTKEGDEFILCTTQFAVRNIEKVLTLLRNDAMFHIEDEHFSGESVRVTGSWQLKGEVAKRLGYSSRSIEEPYSSFGSFEIRGSILELSTHSERRQGIGAEFLCEKLGDAVEVLEVDRRGVQQLIDSIDESAPDWIDTRKENEELMKNPEVQAILREQMNEYYFNEWIYTPLPALDGLTPSEAHKEDPEGLEELLKEIEQSEQRKPETKYHIDLEKLREAIAHASDEQDLDETDHGIFELARGINKEITNLVIQHFKINLGKEDSIELEEDSVGIFSVENDLMIARVLDVQEKVITIRTIPGGLASVAPTEVVYVFPREEGETVVDSVKDLCRVMIRGVYFASENDVDPAAKEIKVFQKIMMLEDQLVDQIVEIVENRADRSIGVEIVDYKKGQQSKRSYFDMQSKTLILAERDLFEALLYSKDFFELHLGLVRKPIKSIAGRLAIFVIYMATLCLYSLEYDRRYNYSDYRFDQLFAEIKSERYERDYEVCSEIIGGRKKLTLRRVNKLKNLIKVS